MFDSAELLSDFRKNAESTTASVHLVSDEQTGLAKLLAKLTKDYQEVMVGEDIRLPESFLKTITPVSHPDHHEISVIPVGITSALCGVAATGSVLIAADDSLMAYLGMLPRHHIVLLRADKIYKRPREVFADPKGWLNGRTSYSFITGPSATADMGALVRGVHGPGKLDIVILGAK